MNSITPTNSESIDQLERTLESAVREYETAIMRIPTNEQEIRGCVDKCVAARERLNLANVHLVSGDLLGSEKLSLAGAVMGCAQISRRANRRGINHP